MTDLAIIETLGPAPGSLSDAELDQTIAWTVSDLASAWRHSLEQGWRLGQLLTEKKQRLGHGAWYPYVEVSLPFNRAQARNLMDLAQANHQFLGDLPEGTTITEAIKLWQRSQRTPRPLPVAGSVERAAPMVRYLIDVPTATIVSGILRVCFPEARTALDPTYGSGNFWDGSAPVEVTGHDLDPFRSPAGPMDVTSLVYADASFDVPLFDPPHLADGGDDAVMAERFGTADEDEIKRVIMLGTQECWRVARMGLVVKVTDHVHSQAFVCETDWVGEAVDWHPLYEICHQVRSRPFIDPKWGQQRSFYGNGSTYLIFKKGDQKHVAR